MGKYNHMRQDKLLDIPAFLDSFFITVSATGLGLEKPSLFCFVDDDGLAWIAPLY